MILVNLLIVCICTNRAIQIEGRAILGKLWVAEGEENNRARQI